MKKLKILIVEPGKEPYESEIENTLAAMQKVVGGYIETMDIDRSDVIIMNEEGKILGLPPNRSFGRDILAGTFFIVSVDGDEFASLTEEKTSFYSGFFHEPLLDYNSDMDDETWEYGL